MWWIGVAVAVVVSSDKVDKSKYKVEHHNKERYHITFRDGTRVETDKVLLPHVTEFYDEAYKYGINVDSINKNYIGVFVEELNDSKLYGITKYNDPSFSLINKIALDSYNITRIVVFHEMAHKYLRVEHCHRDCNGILAAVINLNLYGEKWEKQKEALFTDAPHMGYGRGK